MREESTNHRNDFMSTIGEKLLISMGLMQRSPLVELGERKRKQLLLEDTTTVKNDFYR